MVSNSFGNENNSTFCEMMWQALAVDGGFALIVLYALLLLHLLTVAWKVAAEEENRQVGCWSAVIFGYTLAAVAASFVFPIFTMQMGMEVFLVNACLYAAATSMERTTERSLRVFAGRLDAEGNCHDRQA